MDNLISEKSKGLENEAQKEKEGQQDREEKKKKRTHILETDFIKLFALLIQTAAVAVLVVCAAAIFLYFSIYDDESMKEGFEGTEYENTHSFSELMMLHLNSLGDYLYGMEIFETDGSYDGNMQIDIGLFFDREELQKIQNIQDADHAEPEQSELHEIQAAKLLEEKMQWSSLQEEQTEEIYKDMLVKSIERQAQVKYFLKDLLAWAEEGIQYDEQGYIKENYLPVDYFSLEEIFPEESARKGFQKKLETVLNELETRYLFYKEGRMKLKESDTNFKYAAFNMSTGELVSNIPEQISGSQNQPNSLEEWMEQAKQIMEFEKYCFVSQNRKELVANFVIENLAGETYSEPYDKIYYRIYHNEEADRLLKSYISPYYIAIGVDTSYPALDEFSKGSTETKQLQLILKSMVILAGISAGIAFLLFLYLTVAAGHKTGYDGIYLTWFDKRKTEPAAGAIGLTGLGLIFLFTYLVLELDGFYKDILSKKFILLWGGGAILCNAVFLTGYLSLVKRLKAKTVWKNSLVKYLLDFFKKKVIKPVFQLWNGRKLITKTAVLYLLFLAANLFLIVALYEKGIILAFLMDMAVGFFLLRDGLERQKILEGLEKITEGDIEYQIVLDNLHGTNFKMGEAVNHMGEGLEHAIASSVKNERLKTDLITNVSHDIKTPLTSIINYVDLLKRENIADEKINGYIKILDVKSQRLKQLTEDLVEASKVSSGNITLEMNQINFVELILQMLGEFEEKFSEKGLELVLELPKEPVIILADGRRVCRILDNLFQNIVKYALENTRVYAGLSTEGKEAVFSLKNISKYALNIHAEELTERFIRGDISRSTEGSGLGLSIAQSLTKLQKGKFDLYVDGDLFKVILVFPIDIKNQEDREMDKKID